MEQLSASNKSAISPTIDVAIPASFRPVKVAFTAAGIVPEIVDGADEDMTNLVRVIFEEPIRKARIPEKGHFRIDACVPPNLELINTDVVDVGRDFAGILDDAVATPGVWRSLPYGQSAFPVAVIYLSSRLPTALPNGRLPEIHGFPLPPFTSTVIASPEASGPAESDIDIASRLAEVETAFSAAVEPIRQHLQAVLRSIEGREFYSFEAAHATAQQIQQLMVRLGVRAECPKTRLPGNLRHRQAPRTKTGTFQIEIMDDAGKRTSRFSSTTFPAVILVPAPKDRRRAT